jgi:hypothetical protein
MHTLRTVAIPISAMGRLDRKLESWRVGCMKTTLDLPAALVREIRLRAVHAGRKFKGMAEDAIRPILALPKKKSKSATRRRITLPLFLCAMI